MKSLISSLIGFVLSVSVNAAPLIEGRVRLDSGESVEAAQVRIFDMTDLRRGAVAQATTDATGYFALPLAALTGRALPQRFALGQNYPNPFNPSTIIPYQLAAAAPVRLEVFNLLGQRIATLVDGERPAGFHTATWHATDAAGRAVGAGVYIYRMTVAAESQTGRMVLVDGQAGVSAGGTASVMPDVSGVGEPAEGVYGLIVSGEGLVPYADPAFRVEAGIAPVELVVSAGQHLAGKATDDDCALCGLFDAFDNLDALIVSASVSDNTPTPGWTFTLRARVQNQGTDEFQNLVLSYYRSQDATISTQDMLLGTDEVGSLAASSTSGDESISLTASSTSGTYYYGACVASVSDEDDTPYSCSPGVRVTVADESDPISIPDANLRAAIAAALGKARGATITKGDMTTLTILNADESGIRNLTGLEFATNLTWLGFHANNISDISALRGLTNLTWLQLKENFLSASSINDHIPALQARGVTVEFDPWFDTTPVITTENLVAQHDGIAQYDDRVVVMGIPGRLTTDPIDFDALAQVFFAHYEDAFDYLMVFSNLADIRDNQHYEYYGTHMGVQNTIQGTGKSRYSPNQTVGSAGKLNAILHFPYNSALLDGPSLHEIMHSWANYAIPTALWAHWGFSSANGQLGGFDRANLVNHGGGRYSAGDFGTVANGGNSLPYSPIELYFAGLIPPSEVPDLWVAEDGEWTDDWDGTFTASQVSTWSIERIVAEHGARIPNSHQSQKDFRAALILLIDSEHPAQQGTLDALSAAVQQFTHAGRDDDDSGFNFWEATGGRATLTMDGLSAYRRSGRASKPVVSYRIVEPVANQDGHIGCVPMGDATEVGKWMVAPSDKGKR